MRNFSIREQLLIFSITILLLILGIVFGINKFNRHEKNIHLKLEELKLQIKQVRSLSNEWEQLQSKLTAPIIQQSLSSLVENIARSIGIQDNLQLNVLTNVKNGLEGIKVGLDRLKLDHLLSMLYKLENNRPILKISNLSITISPGEREIRASFQVKKQKKVE